MKKGILQKLTFIVLSMSTHQIYPLAKALKDASSQHSENSKLLGKFFTFAIPYRFSLKSLVLITLTHFFILKIENYE